MDKRTPLLLTARSALVKALCSLQLAIVCLLLLIVLVVACTLAQVNLGTSGAVALFMRSFIVWWRPEGWTSSLPIFPGGALVGLVLVVNLIAAQVKRLAFTFSNLGLWLVHAGLILLVAAEFASAALQVDARMPIEEGQTLNYVEVPNQVELALTDSTDPRFEQVYSVPESILKAGRTVAIPGTNLSARAHFYYPNADLRRRLPGEHPAQADRGVGAELAVREAPPVTSEDASDIPTTLVEFFAGQKSYGTWLVSEGLGAPQSFLHEGHSYALSLGPRRDYLPYTITLLKFSHDVYPGTDIPKNFSSLVRLSDPERGEVRDVLISMNQPLRYRGLTYYQSSFGKNDTLSIFQVVNNPGWRLPYLSCALVTLGLLFHFTLRLQRSQRNQRSRRIAMTPAEAV